MNTPQGETGYRSYCGKWFQLSKDCGSHERKCSHCHDKIEQESQERWDAYVEECRQDDLDDLGN